METNAPRSFAINPGTIKLPLNPQRLGEVTVTVTNSSQAFKKGFIRSVPLQVTDPKQPRPDLVIDGDKERPFEKGAAQQFKVKVSAKPEVKAGTYQFRVDVANSADPEGDWTEGPAIEVAVPAPVMAAPHKTAIWPFILIGAAVVLIAGGIGLYFILRPSDKTIDVPNLVGMTFAEAQKAAEDVHLKVEVDDSDKDAAKDDAGKDSKKDPKDDSKDDKKDEKKDPKGSGKKTDDKKVEDKKPDDKKDSKEASAKDGGDPAKKSPKGKVKSQDPAAGEKAAPDSVVSLVLGSGEGTPPPDPTSTDHPIVIPSVKGLTVEQAKLHLYDAGFTPKVAAPEFKGATPGTIDEQNPAAGTKAEKGSEVTITPEKDNVQLTSLLQKTLKDAVFELNRLKLIGQIVYQNTPGPATDHVIDQNPKSGARVEVGSTVTVTVPRGIVLPILPKEEVRHLVPLSALMFATPNSLTGVTVTPASPAFFHKAGSISISCHYSTTEGGKAKVTAEALTGGKQATGSSLPSIVTDASGKGEMKTTITLHAPTPVDSIRVQLIGSDGKVLDTEQLSVKFTLLPF